MKILNDTNLIGKWTDRISNEGWYLFRFDTTPDDEANRVVYCSINGTGDERSIDIHHEAMGCHRVPYNGILKGYKVIYIKKFII